MKVHEVVARALKDLGVNYLFGLIGDANLFMVNSYQRDCAGRYIASSHEAGAVLMAIGYARVSGELGAATVTHGPGVTNTVTALVEGVKSAVPMILLAGDTPAADREHPQKVDQKAMVLASGAGFEQLRSADSVAEDLNRAAYRAWIERRPIVFNMPIELQWEEATYQKQVLRLPETRSAIAASADMDDAIGIIASARRPVVIAGAGVVFSGAGAEASVLRFAERIEAPVATTLRGKGLFSADPFNLGICGTVGHEVAVEEISASDCVISFGASLNRHTTSSGELIKGKRIVQINSLASEIGRLVPATAGLVGDPGLTAAHMTKWLEEAEIPGSGARTEVLRDKIAAFHQQRQCMPRAPAAGTVDLFAMLQTVDHMFPKNRVYVSGTGRYMRAAWPSIQVGRPRDFVDTIGFGAIGLGVGEAIGAAVAANGRPTLLVLGDGGLLLGGLNELATVAREKLNLVIVVCNDGGYGAEYIQFVNRGMDPGLSMMPSLGFGAIADAFGIQSRSISDIDELEGVMEEIVRRNEARPFLIDVKIDPAMTPYYHITSSKRT